ncbi:Permease of the drug/metabolite transporter (DMT) superfamily [Paucidesulfovibrio gracilis DSM 16080]|uniref:Permease of the drug/metabolite transporter (DMT) superfamily n=1 Tax=Paucidesulfovibrio gracilis DSM 16080 TaxID=1121449 RepID=A0A1T4WDS7_9BACT|nr:DMT family transporter [Paucidesulfovibrio gracilis]SKA75168.1 Permease of the drug/metabolite transporter (DMT) superfamily [Paucidesulfovibrio gracilis DSM 16080]
MKQQHKAYAYGLVTVLLWSTVATAFKLGLRAMEPVQLLWYSSVFSTLLLGGLLALQGRLTDALRCTPREWLRSLLLGVLSPFLYYLILFETYTLLPAQEAQPLNYTWAITLTLLSIPLLGQRVSRHDMLAALVSYSGVVVISTRGNPFTMEFTNPLGVGLALLSTVVWSLYWIGNTKEDREPVAALFTCFVASLPLVTLWCVCTDGIVVRDSGGLVWAAYIGAFEMGISFVLWLTALRLSETTAKVGNLIFLAPFLSLVFIHFLLGEEIFPSTFVGLALIVAGLILQRMGAARA